MTASYKSPLHQMVSTTKTDLWNDSCSVEETDLFHQSWSGGSDLQPDYCF